jgi:hypothetical protein
MGFRLASGVHAIGDKNTHGLQAVFRGSPSVLQGVTEKHKALSALPHAPHLEGHALAVFF